MKKARLLCGCLLATLLIGAVAGVYGYHHKHKGHHKGHWGHRGSGFSIYFGGGGPGWSTWRTHGWHRPTVVRYVQPIPVGCNVTPAQVEQMKNEVLNIMGSQANLSIAVKSVGNNFKIEYNEYVQLLNSNSSAAPIKACKLEGIYESFMEAASAEMLPAATPLQPIK